MTKVERITSRVTAGLIADRLLLHASMCEQRSHLPGDAEWTTQSPQDMPVNVSLTQPAEPSDCIQCRRSWARRMRGVSSLPGGNQEETSSGWKAERCEASSGLPGDNYQLGEGVEPALYESEAEGLEGDFCQKSRKALDESQYRYDPKHENKPAGPGWHETDKGWSQAEEAGKPSSGQQTQPVQQQQKPKVTIHIPEHQLTHRVKLKKPDLVNVLNSGHYSIISAGRNFRDPKEHDLSPTDASFHERTLQLRDDLEKAGVKYTEVVGVYDSLEPSFMVLHDHDEPFTEKTARDFMVHHQGASDRKTIATLNRLGEKYNQDSVLHVSAGKNTMVFTTGPLKGKHCGNKGWQEVPDAKNYFTDIPVQDKENTKVSLNIQDCFDRKYLASEIAAVARLVMASDESSYRWDPKHHHRPLGGKWRKTPAGWSQEPVGAKPGPEPKKKVEKKPGATGVKQVDTQTQNG